jgi:hypothetical protein
MATDEGKVVYTSLTTLYLRGAENLAPTRADSKETIDLREKATSRCETSLQCAVTAVGYYNYGKFIFKVYFFVQAGAVISGAPHIFNADLLSIGHFVIEAEAITIEMKAYDQTIGYMHVYSRQGYYIIARHPMSLTAAKSPRHNAGENVFAR